MVPKRTEKISCFGELLLRFALPQQWTTHQSLPYYIGGAELNVATALARWGGNTSYVTALPDNYITEELIDYIKIIGISADNILLTGERVGTYYLPEGNDVKSNCVIYDRKHSSFSGLKPGEIDWDVAFKDCSRFHFSAISPALNENVALVCKEAVEAAKAKGLKISVDLNYRNKLWKYGTEPIQIMRDLVRHCDVIMGNMWSVESLLGIPSPIKDSSGVPDLLITEGAVESMRVLSESFPDAGTIAYTQRFNNRYYGILQQSAESFVSDVHMLQDIKGPVGSGDCFMAGLIYALVSQLEPKDIINFATSAAVGKLYESGDATNQSVKDINKRMYGK